MPIDESSPLLQFPGSNRSQVGAYGDLHDQFCNLSGVPPMNMPVKDRGKPHPESLYHRAVTHRRHQSAIYMFTASLVNTLLLSQVVLGATLTGLGASDSSRILITIFGALNTVIAGLIAFLKSRGQPMRARMFRDDLERVVDEIENSAVMWLGISRGVHGYSAIDTDEQVTVRSEVARLTRLYDRAVKTNTMNDPDMYAAGVVTDFHSAALRGGKPGQPALPAPVDSTAAPGSTTAVTAAPAPSPINDPDESPASKAAIKSAEKTSKSETPPEVDQPKKAEETAKTPDIVAGATQEDGPASATVSNGASDREVEAGNSSKGNIKNGDPSNKDSTDP